MSIILIGTVLEITRRTTGLSLPTIGLIFYAHYGKYIPSDLGHRGYRWVRKLSDLNSMDAIFRVPVDASATIAYVYSFLGRKPGAKGIKKYKRNRGMKK